MASSLGADQIPNGHDGAYQRWRTSLVDLLDHPAKVTAWQDARYEFAYRLGELLTGPGPDGPPVADHVVYGVYMRGSGLVYVGQTADAKRRLRDLPVGESHHIATTIPPEIWERVVVVQWPGLVSQLVNEEAQAVQELGLETCGLAVEHLLQVAYQPILNSRRRGNAGTWSARNVDTSRSRGAAASVKVPQLSSLVRQHWDMLEGLSWNGHGEPILCSSAGRAVFPGGIDGQQAE